MGRRLIALALIPMASMLPARATTPPPGIVAAAHYTFWPGDARWPELELRIGRGASLVFVNAGTEAPHNLQEIGGTPRFSSGEAIPPGGVAEVEGVSTLPPGSYAFECRIHADLMVGTLIVDGR